MKIVKFKAGLGNQMFQYAFLRLLQTKYGFEEVLADTSYFEHKDYKKYLDSGINLLSVEYCTASKKQLHRILVPYNGFEPHRPMHRLVVGSQAILNPNYYFEKNRDYVNVSSILKYSYFDGYWQSWRYLEPVRDLLLKEFQPKSKLSKKTQGFVSKYRSMNSVFVGVRKGDYTESSKSTEHYGAPCLEYYKKAIAIILDKVDNPFFVVFSDDIDWVKEKLDFRQAGILDGQIEYRDIEKIHSNFEELYVMASCKHAVMSNSNFNFWGAWMINNPDKIVVAPIEWFKDGKPIDIIPTEWNRI